MAFAVNSFGAQAPYLPKDEAILQKGVVNGNAGSIPIVNESGKLVEGRRGVDGHSALRIARAEYDVATDGGTVGTYDLGIDLPANAMIMQSWFYIDTAFVDSGAGTVALHCEDAGNIKAATDLTAISTGVLTNGIQVGFDDITTVSTGIAAACDVTATVAGVDQTAGKLTLWLLYTVHN